MTLPIPAAQIASATTMVVTATRGNIHQARPTRCAGLPPNLTDLCSIRSSSSRLRDTNTYHLRQPRGALQGLTRKTPPRGFVHYLYYTIYHEHGLPDWRFLEADPRLRSPILTSLYRNDKGPREPFYKLDFTPDKSGRLPPGSMESTGHHSTFGFIVTLCVSNSNTWPYQASRSSTCLDRMAGSALFSAIEQSLPFL